MKWSLIWCMELRIEVILFENRVTKLASRLYHLPERFSSLYCRKDSSQFLAVLYSGAWYWLSSLTGRPDNRQGCLSFSHFHISLNLQEYSLRSSFREQRFLSVKTLLLIRKYFHHEVLYGCHFPFPNDILWSCHHVSYFCSSIRLGPATCSPERRGSVSSENKPGKRTAYIIHDTDWGKISFYNSLDCLILRDRDDTLTGHCTAGHRLKLEINITVST